MRSLENRIVPLLKQVVTWLVKGDYFAIEVRSRSIRLSADMMRQTIEEYGRSLIVPPDSVFSNLDAIRVANADMPTLSIRLDLWTIEEGRSDLTLECTVIDKGGEVFEIEIDGIHVL